MFIIYLLFILFFYIFTYCISFNNNTENTLHDIKIKSIKQAEKIIIDFFYNCIKKNNHICLDDCILLFENSKHNNLNDFSKSNMRTPESYRQIYHKFYLISKNKIKKNI